MSITKQETTWKGEFGKEYTDRFYQGIDEIESRFIDDYGVSRRELDREFLGSLDRSIKILEVGCGVGMKLYSLQQLGFTNLCGIDVQRYAVERSKQVHSSMDIICGRANDIPFKDSYFDVVFTSGLLIHISPENIHEVLSEIYRCSSKYIWGWEYYSDSYEKVVYRENEELLWKADFAKLYIEHFPDLVLVKSKRVELQKEKGKNNQMFLLKKECKDV